MTAFRAERRLAMVKAGAQPGSVRRLWYAMACGTLSGPDHEPATSAEEVLRISRRVPEGRVRSMREPAPTSVLITTVPDSSSDPAMRRAVPVRVTSVSVWPPARAAREFWRKVCAGGLDVT